MCAKPTFPVAVALPGPRDIARDTGADEGKKSRMLRDVRTAWKGGSWGSPDWGKSGGGLQAEPAPGGGGERKGGGEGEGVRGEKGGGEGGDSQQAGPPPEP